MLVFENVQDLASMNVQHKYEINLLNIFIYRVNGAFLINLW